MRKLVPVALLLVLLAPAAALLAEDSGADDDPYIWLEDVDGAKALAWAKEQNDRTLPVLEKVKEFKPIEKRALEILDSEEKIAYPAMRGDDIYNFWQDKQHPRGIWRRTPLASYRSPSPQWETVLDIDAMVAKDGTLWVWKGADCLPPEYALCLVSLSKGGSDAVDVREFDTRTKSFVKDGFSLPTAKSSTSWLDENTLWVGTDFGPGTLTTSGYPRIVKLWKRGTPLSEAKTIFEGPVDSVGAFGSSQITPEGRYDIVTVIPAFFRQTTFLRLGDRLVKLDLPEDVQIRGYFKDHLLISLRSDWEVGGSTYPQGALLAIGLDDFLRGGRSFDVLFKPSARISLDDVSTTRDRVILSVLDNVRGKLETLTPGPEGWKKGDIPLPGIGTVRVTATNDWRDSYFYSYNDFLTPVSLFYEEAGTSAKVKTSPEFFDSTGMTVEQHEATSEDGTKIPYFVVMPKGFKADGKAPTLLYGYGGFEVPEVPRYSGIVGSAWLERGGVYALANIRGGGEFGPAWHIAALKHNRIKAYQDFIAVAEDLIARKITSTPHLGIMGGSQGGLLVSGTMVLRPDLFGAVVVQVPLTDMRRFNKLLAGASWMAEYGNPDDPNDWAYIKQWSPYQNVKKDVTYPTPFFWTNTRDDRVHPGHARKMVAKMLDQGHPVYYFENIEGGHGAGSVNSQRAMVDALEYAYLWKMIR
ncbi:MAG TPA: prolyl oligopeptidase family serine peptidase [Candidatus Saccharimonadales bacterium]|nr:prolyl oligopeptidase family serine peptidase [Candidatus Saccharimonadales bacterium]